jgi:hypothetical protein
MRPLGGNSHAYVGYLDAATREMQALRFIDAPFDVHPGIRIQRVYAPAL